ncbi:MAG: hypothetical protein AVDCRST_MAG68-4496 [uncultured Gemmatimonadetes bacterium]|uniref:Uncharacterized protein n=1 Tax=uncultured Gemmatimonadota bacterium TaxID=203437 RepID=A0A6J4MJS9_9BACT|nr:MAG: hypothetical protein AVDCRST_MAG68-4496 [uncultured Gemmatimonadota bacterium]
MKYRAYAVYLAGVFLFGLVYALIKSAVPELVLYLIAIVYCMLLRILADRLDGRNISSPPRKSAKR